MDRAGFARFCKEGKRVRKGLKKDEIEDNLRSVQDFETFLRSSSGRDFRKATARDTVTYMSALIERKQNTLDRVLGMLRYARFAGNKEVELALMKMLDGVDVLGILSNTICEEIGSKRRDMVFRGIALPQVGTWPDEWHVITKKFMGQLVAEVGEQKAREILLTGPHAGPAEYYKEDREEYLRSDSIDDYLKRRHKKAVDLLAEHMREKTLFFNQEIDKDVLAFVRANQEIMGGVRRGDVIYETKVPYMVKEYLAENDDRMKRYYACHCPWVREAIRTGADVPGDFCYCSAGYHKKPWDVVFAEPVEVKLLNSALEGGATCRFAIRIPKEHLKKSIPRTSAKKKQRKA